MTNKTELAELKSYLFDIARHNIIIPADNEIGHEAQKDMTVTDANVMISEANKAAYDSLDEDENASITQIGEVLQVKIAERNGHATLGDAGQLELIAAIGAVLNEIGGSDEIHA